MSIYGFKVKAQDGSEVSQVISLDLDGNVIHNVSFMGGCNGNLKAIPIFSSRAGPWKMWRAS